MQLSPRVARPQFARGSRGCWLRSHAAQFGSFLFFFFFFFFFFSLAVAGLRAEELTFTGSVGTGWYDLQFVNDIDPNCIVFKNNWGKQGCPPDFPTPIDSVKLEADAVLGALASVLNFTSEASGGGTFTIESIGILAVTFNMEAGKLVEVEGLLGASSIHHTDILRIFGSVDTMSLDSDGNVEITDGNLSITNLGGNASYTVKSGKSLSFSGGLVAVDQSIEVQSSGSFTWDSGEVLTNQMAFQSGSNVSIGSLISSVPISNLNGGTLNNFTTAHIVGGQWWINAGATVNNHGTLQFEGTNPLVDTTTIASGTIENFGTVQNTATMARINRTLLHNIGTVQVDSGTLDIAGGGESMGMDMTTGRFLIAAGAEVLFGTNLPTQVYTLNSGTKIIGDGFAHVTGTLVVADGVTVPAENVYVEGQLAGTGVGATLEVSHLLRFSNGLIQGGTTRILPGAELHIEDGAAGADTIKLLDTGLLLDNQGLTTWTGEGQLWINGGSVFHNAAGGTFHIQNATIMDTTSQASATFDNDGTLLKTSGGTTRISRTRLENHGLVQIDSGILDVSGGGMSDAPFTIAPGAELLFGTNSPTQLYTVGSGTSFAAGGLLHVTGAVAVASGATASAERLHLEGQLIGPGTLSVSNMLDWTAGSQSGGHTIIEAAAQLNLSGSADKTLTTGHLLENLGTATWQGTGKLLINDGAEFRNASGDSFLVANNADMDTTSQASGSFTNLGTFRKTSGGTSRINRTRFDNQGLVEVNSGTLDIAGGGTSSGDFSLAGGAVVQFGTNSPTLLYTLQNGTDFTGAGTARVTGAVSIGTGHTATADNFELASGSVSGGGTLEINNQLNWMGGSFAGGTATVKASAMLNLSGTAANTLANAHTLDLYGTGTWIGTGALNVNGGSRITVRSGGSLDIQTDAIVDSPSFPAGMVDVLGILSKSNSAGTSRFFRTLLNNSGTVHVSSGILQLAGGGQSSGAFLVDGGATLEFAVGSVYTLAAGTTIRGDGPARVTGIVQIPSGANALADRIDYVSGLIIGLGTLTINEELNLPGSVNKTLDTLVVQNNGTTNWTGTGQLLLNNGAGFNNAAVGMFINEVDGTVDTTDFPQGTFNNAGSWIKRNSAGTTRFFRTPFHNTGLVDIQTGTLRLESAGTHSGSFQMAGGTSVQFAAGLHTLNNGGQFGGSGLLRLNGATAQVPAAAIVSMRHADLTAGALNVSGQLTVSGTFNWTGGSLAINDAGRLINSGTQTFHAGVSSTVTHSGAATARFQNTGTFEKTAATGTTRFAAGAAFDNSGTTNVRSGSTLQLSGGGTSTAPFHLDSGGVLLFDVSAYDWNAGTVIDGTGVARITGPVNVAAGATVPVDRLQLFGGTLSQAGVVQVNTDFSWTAGTLATGTLRIQPGATATIAGPSSMTLNGHTLANYGTLLWTGGGISASSSPTINNHLGGVFDISSNALLAGPGTLNNEGLLAKTAGAGTSLIGLATMNTGAVQSASGTLQFTGGFSQMAGATTLAGGNLASSTAMNFFGGLLNGNGTVSGQVNNLGAVVSPGLSPGTISIAGGYTQGPDGVLAMEIAGTDPSQFDHLNITIGTAMLDGTLDVSLVGYIPAAGDIFEVLSAASGVSGTFSTVNVPTVVGGTSLAWQVHYNFSNVRLEVLTALPGDLNGDGFVGQDDLNFILGHWGTNVTAGSSMMGDPSGDGFVGQDDLNILLGHWGEGTPPLTLAGSSVSAAAVPEPSSLALAMLTVAMMCRYRKRFRQSLLGRSKYRPAPSALVSVDPRELFSARMSALLPETAKTARIG